MAKKLKPFARDPGEISDEILKIMLKSIKPLVHFGPRRAYDLYECNNSYNKKLYFIRDVNPRTKSFLENPK